MTKRSSFNRRRAERAANLVLTTMAGNSYGEYDLDAPIKALRKSGFTVKCFSGCARIAYIIDGKFVVKVPYEDEAPRRAPRFKSLEREYRLIQKFRKNALYRYNVPETYLVRYKKDEKRVALVQECVPILDRVSDREMKKLGIYGLYGYEQFERDAEELNEILRIGDFHSGNVGLRRVNGRTIPVFIDLDYSGQIRTPTLARLRRCHQWPAVQRMISDP